VAGRWWQAVGGTACIGGRRGLRGNCAQKQMNLPAVPGVTQVADESPPLRPLPSQGMQEGCHAAWPERASPRRVKAPRASAAHVVVACAEEDPRCHAYAVVGV